MVDNPFQIHGVAYELTLVCPYNTLKRLSRLNRLFHRIVTKDGWWSTRCQTEFGVELPPSTLYSPQQRYLKVRSRFEMFVGAEQFIPIHDCLTMAVKQNNLELVRTFVELGAAQLRDPLTVAVRLNYQEIVEYLSTLYIRSDHEIECDRFERLLWTQSYDEIDRYLESDPNSCDNIQELINFAAEHGLMELFDRYLPRYGKIVGCSDWSPSAIERAIDRSTNYNSMFYEVCESGSLQLIQRFERVALTAQHSLNYKDGLCSACQGKNVGVDVIEYLIEKVAPFDERWFFYEAIEHSSDSVVSFLLNYMAEHKLNWLTNRGRIVMAAIRHHDPDRLSMLLKLVRGGLETVRQLFGHGLLRAGLPVIKYLDSIVPFRTLFETQDGCQDIIEALYYSFSNGKLDQIRWIVDQLSTMSTECRELVLTSTPYVSKGVNLLLDSYYTATFRPIRIRVLRSSRRLYYNDVDVTAELREAAALLSSDDPDYNSDPDYIGL